MGVQLRDGDLSPVGFLGDMAGPGSVIQKG